jgi:lanthanide-dependent methanol dehydrogenase
LLAGQLLPIAAQSAPIDASASDPPSAQTRFSDLSEVNADNVAGLKLAFAFRTGSPGGHGAEPQVMGGTLLVLTPFPHTLFALDLRADAMGRVKWTYRPAPNFRAEALATAKAVSEGPTVTGGRVYLNTLDGHTVALDAETGRVAWDIVTAELGRGETLTAAPLVVQNRVLVGSSGSDFGARGWLAAVDADTGREIWRRYSTGPDQDVGVGADFRSPYSGGGEDQGVKSWPPTAWEHGGGNVSGQLLYDPALGLVFGGSGPPAPMNPEQRPGENLWTSGLFARDLDGALRWFDPMNPHDLYGFGATAPNLMIDRDWNGAPRHLLIHADANGFLYVVDRTTGEILSAKFFAPVNIASGVDLKTGELQPNVAKALSFNTMTRDVCPGGTGAAGGAPAYSPATGFAYLPVSRLCMDIEARNANFIAGTPFVGVNVRLRPPRDGPRGALVGWNIVKGQPAWSVAETFPLAGGALATAGGLVFYGTLDGLFKAVDARSGKELWRYQMASGIISQPTTFRAPDGHQYVAVLTGLGGRFGVARNGVDKRDATALEGAGNALRDLPRPADESGALYVFKLP